MRIVVQKMNSLIRQEYSLNYCELMEFLQGREIEVDTSILSFQRCYLKEGHNDLYRVFYEHVDKIIDDVRVGMSKCMSCGDHFETGFNHNCGYANNSIMEFFPGTVVGNTMDNMIDLAFKEIYQIEGMT